MNHTKEEWKILTSEFLDKNKGKNVSIFKISNLKGSVPLNLKEAVEELVKESTIFSKKDTEGKKWLRYKE
jgi:hypothetical protein